MNDNIAAFLLDVSISNCLLIILPHQIYEAVNVLTSCFCCLQVAKKLLKQL